MGAPSRCVAVMAAWGLAAVGGCKSSAPAPAPKVTIHGGTWRVELATTSEQRYRGLADRTRLDADAGMLFIFPNPDVREFCMRQCLIPLDVAFIDVQGQVVKIHTMPVEPYGLDRAVYSSEKPAQYALEVRAGALAEAGVKIGDRVEFSADVPPPQSVEEEEP